MANRQNGNVVQLVHSVFTAGTVARLSDGQLLAQFATRSGNAAELAYRTPILLCYFEGLTHDQAASLLNWPVGTVRSWLSRARERLRTRLTRRGIAPDAAYLYVLTFRLGSVPAIPSDASLYLGKDDGWPYKLSSAISSARLCCAECRTASTWTVSPRIVNNTR